MPSGHPHGPGGGAGPVGRNGRVRLEHHECSGTGELVEHLLADAEELDKKRAAARETYTKMFQRESILGRYAATLKGLC